VKTGMNPQENIGLQLPVDVFYSHKKTTLDLEGLQKNKVVLTYLLQSKFRT
jgi:hypothetical protein